MERVFEYMEELISVIVPVYNVEKYLKKCVDSIINQTYKNIEIILVDDGSTDNSGNLCEEYANNDSRIKVIHKENGGLSSARNVGIKIATGEFIGFVDSDDWIDRCMYERLYTLINQYNSDIAVCGLMRTRNEKDLVNVGKRQIECLNQEAYIKRYFKIGYQECEYYAVTKLYKRNLLEEQQYPINLTSEDVLGTYKAILKANKIVVTSEILYFYRYNEKSITGKFSTKDFDLIEIWDKVVEITKNEKKEYLYYAELNRKRINFTLLYRLAKNFSTDELKGNPKVNELLKKLNDDEKILLKSKIAFSRKVLIFLFCRNYFFSAKLIKFIG